jgi:membrane protein involved in D-alanine export
MGLWHGIELHYILYGLYQATLLSAFHIFSNWKKVHQHWREGPLWNALALFLTFNAVCFGLLIFSGHLSSMANTQRPSAEFAMLKSVH